MKPLSPRILAFVSLWLLPSVHAQSSSDSETTNTSVTTMDEVVVTANRFNLTLFDQVQPATVLKDRDLQLNLQPTLGDTLNREPGVSSTSFGPGASRPIVRGLGDDRVRILQNGTSVIDVSNVSPDHAVATDPLSVRSVEVVRGPATLLYGPNTMGGVVNVIDDRIPREKFTGVWPTGSLETRVGSADELFSQSGAITWGAGPIVFHLDAFTRETDDLHIPGYARSERLRLTSPLPPGTPEPYGVLPNSDTESKGASLGGSYIWEGGYLGMSFSGVDSVYGTVAEPDVNIGLRQRRWDMRGAFYKPAPWIKEVDFKFGFSDYDHTEFEGPSPGTQFLIEGYNGRVELMHEKLGLFEGAFGIETQQTEFSALGAEAFLPKVDNSSFSTFFFEEIGLNPVRLQFGARYDHQSNETETSAGFGPGQKRDFDAFSTSAGIVYTPVENYAIAFSVGFSQRPPTYVELFANGPHVATGTFEVGNANLGTEDCLSLDLSLRKKSGRVTGSIGGFYYRFNDFISLQPTGAFDPVDGLPIFNYQAIGAEFYGAEMETTFHLLGAVDGENTASPKDSRLDLTLRADFVNAKDRRTGEPVPRIPPLRTSAALEYQIGGWNARLEGQYAAKQDRHANFELPTDEYFLVNASISYDFKIGGLDSTVYVKGINLTDEEARQSTSFLKDIAPMAGRGVLVGMKTTF